MGGGTHTGTRRGPVRAVQARLATAVAVVAATVVVGAGGAGPVGAASAPAPAGSATTSTSTTRAPVTPTTLAPTTTTRAPTTTTTRAPTTTTLAPTTTTTRDPATTTTTTTTTVPLPPFVGPPPWYTRLYPAVAPVPFTGPAGAPKVGVITDSLLSGGGDTLTAALGERGLQASVNVLSGYPTWGVAPTARQLAGQATNVLVVATGTNDLRDLAQGHRTPDEVRASMDDLLAGARVPCVVWVGLNTSNGLHGGGEGSFGDVRVGGPVVNRLIRDAEAASGRPSARTLYGDWATRSAGHPDWFRGPDDVHLSPTGLAEYSQLILDGVAACRTALTEVNDPYPTTDRSSAVPRLDVTSTTSQGYGASAGYVDVTSFNRTYAGAGDRLVYDVQYYSRAARIGIDLTTTDGQYLRSTKAVDQNGLRADPATLLDARAGGRWYTRDIPLPSTFAGKVVDRLLIGAEADSVNAAGAVRRIRLVTSTGATRAVLWDGGAPAAVRWSSAGGTSVTVTLTPASAAR